jgi:hypothetical protein
VRKRPSAVNQRTVAQMHPIVVAGRDHTRGGPGIVDWY